MRHLNIWRSYLQMAREWMQAMMEAEDESS
jgi:hypothetical protein